MRIILSVSLLIALASCVAPPKSEPAPAPPPAPAPAPAPSTPVPDIAWQDRPAAIGDWAYRAEPGGSIAAFGPPASGAVVALRCELATRQVSLSRAGSGASQMTVRTSFGSVQWPAESSPAPAPYVVARRSAGDATLDQIAFSRGRFAVEVPGMPLLVLPAWAEVTRVIEDCRG